MTDGRFFTATHPLSLGEICGKIGTEIPSDAPKGLLLRGVAPPEAAGPDEIGVFWDSRYAAALARTRAAIVVTSSSLAHHVPKHVCRIVVPQPHLAYAQICRLFYPAVTSNAVIDPHAHIDPRAAIGPDCQIDAGAVVGEGAQIGAGCHIGPNAVIGAGVILGKQCSVGANTSIGHALIGDHVVIATCVSIGGQGFGFVETPTGLMRVPQLGRVILEDGVAVGSNTAIDRGTSADTVIGAGTMIDNLVQIAHNVTIGRHCVIAGQVGIAGSTAIGDEVMIGGRAAISDHIHVGSRARIAGASGVMRDIPDGASVAGCPAVPVRLWHRQTVALSRLVNRRS